MGRWNKVRVVRWRCGSNGNVRFGWVWYKNGLGKKIGSDGVGRDMSEGIMINFLKWIGKVLKTSFRWKGRKIKINGEVKMKGGIKGGGGLLWGGKNR